MDASDALAILRHTTNLPRSGDCIGSAGDVDCSGVIDSLDSLDVLLFVAHLPQNLPPGCVPVVG